MTLCPVRAPITPHVVHTQLPGLLAPAAVPCITAMMQCIFFTRDGDVLPDAPDTTLHIALSEHNCFIVAPNTGCQSRANRLCSCVWGSAMQNGLVFPMFAVVFAVVACGMELMLITDHTCMTYTHLEDMNVGEFARVVNDAYDAGMIAWFSMHSYLVTWLVGATASVAIVYLQLRASRMRTVLGTYWMYLYSDYAERMRAIIYASIITIWTLVQTTMATSTQVETAMWWRCSRWRFAGCLIVVAVSFKLAMWPHADSSEVARAKMH